MACETIADILVRDTGRYLPDEIYRRVFPTSPVLTLTPRGEFPPGLGFTPYNMLLYERTMPAAYPVWSEIQSATTLIDGAEGGSCLPPVTKVTVGSTTRQMRLFRHAFEGPDFCNVDLLTPFELRSQLQQITGILADYIRFVWEWKDQTSYFEWCGKKCIVDGCPPTFVETEAIIGDGVTWDDVATAAGATCPTAKLDYEILSYAYMRLLRDGAAEGSVMPMMNGPNFLVLSSHETIEGILRDNTEIRQDIRWGAPSKLLEPFGQLASYRNFTFLAVPYPRRFECEAGVYTEVVPFTFTAATKGLRAIVNPSWLTATYEESVIFNRSVRTQLIPSPPTNAAPGFQFNPVNYTGVWQAKNILDRVCNPNGNIIYHRADLMASEQPNRPEHGVAFLHLRCDPACNLVTTCVS